MPAGASSWRRDSAIASSANFDASYGPSNGVEIRPPMEPMKTTRPPNPRARISGSTARVTASWPITLTSNCRRQSSRGRYSIGPPMAMPALLTTAVSRSPIAPTALSTPGSSVTSSRTGSSRPPAGAAAASRWPSSSRRTPANTCQPRSARWRAQASPIPVDAPVISTERMGEFFHDPGLPRRGPDVDKCHPGRKVAFSPTGEE